MATSKGSAKGGAKAAAKKGGASASGAARPAAGAVPPYGVAIREAAARGDAAEMRKVANNARKWIKDAQAALDKLDQKLSKAGGK